MKNKLEVILVTLIIFLITIIIFLPTIVNAEKVTLKSIDPSPYYDNQPKIWDNYVVWRRAINLNDNSYIELNEPSWIVVHNLKTGNTWNITPPNAIMRNNVYYHAQSPDIWDGKIIYEAQASDNSYDTRLYMYNISSKKTWELPLYYSEYTSGRLHLIYEDWIVYTNREGYDRYAYLYNYKDNTHRVIIGKTSNYTTYGFAMDDKNVIFTLKNDTGNMSLHLYNLKTTNLQELHIDIDYKRIMATSIHKGVVGICTQTRYLNETNITKTVWQSYTYMYEGDSLQLISNESHGILVWDEQYAYENNDRIHFINHNIGMHTLLNSEDTLYMGDIYENNIVWIDNKNSEIKYTDARADYDVYVRTVITDDVINYTNLAYLIIVVSIIIVVLALKGKERY